MFNPLKPSQNSRREYDSSSQTSEGEGLISGLSQRSHHRTQRWLPAIVSGVITAICSSGLTTLAIGRGWSEQSLNLQLGCGTGAVDGPDFPRDRNSPFAHLDRSFHIKYTKPFNYSGDPYTEHPSLGRVDALWSDTMGVEANVILIPESQAIQFGYDRQHHVYRTGAQNLEGGDGGYLAQIEAVHQMHCLNELRKALWFNHDWYKAHPEAEIPEDVLISHTNHCLENLRERLECTAELALYPYVYTDFARGYVARFDQPHKCQDFKAIREFSRKHESSTKFAEESVRRPPPGTLVYTLDNFS